MSLLRTNGLKWVTDKAPKAAVHHVLSVIRPAELRTRLEQDIAFSHNHLNADFAGFMKHALDVSETFEKVDSGPQWSHKSDREGEKPKKDRGGGGHVGSSSSKASTKHDRKAGQNSKEPPPSPCPLPRCKGKNTFHWVTNCPDHTEAEKR